MASAGVADGADPAVVVLATVGACGTPSERRDSVTAHVTRFERALDAGQRERLCTALAHVPAAGAVRHVDVYGDQARVVLDRLYFLTTFLLALAGQAVAGRG